MKKPEDYIQLLKNKIQIKTMQMIEEMSSVNDPWDLFEPHFWYDKLGEDLWHCSMRSTSGPIIEEAGDTLEEAVKKVYDKMLEIGERYAERSI